MALVEGANRAAVVQGLGHELPKLVARVRIPAAAPLFAHLFAILQCKFHCPAGII